MNMKDTNSNLSSSIAPWLTSLASGLVFGLGLLISGMANPDKVIGFLDLAGAWDPSLAFVMGGAILVGVVAFAISKKRTMSFLGQPMRMPTSTDIDKKLILGGVLFGLGWGLAGFCPGPALVSITSLDPKVLLFVGSMLAGMLVFELFERSKSK
jgi:uncharacterized protein